jgi:hypothetical protein
LLVACVKNAALLVSLLQASFLSEGMELLQQAKDEMEALAAAVSQAQVCGAAPCFEMCYR